MLAAEQPPAQRIEQPILARYAQQIADDAVLTVLSLIGFLALRE
ncbi:hypothetical protein [Nocardia cyriacigeorgica]|nr:hypothetical protein [Nocardia cyriacigeorgica]